MSEPIEPPRVAVVGGGPAGLMAAETLRAGGAHVDLYEACGSLGRKFLLAGKGGLNLTHSDPPELFARRYRERASEVGRWLQAFGPRALCEWAHGLGVDTYVGSSGRVFPRDRKAAPLLRGWVRRLREQGVAIHVQHRWLDWDAQGRLRLATPAGERLACADAVVLALGGGSWPRLGADGRWTGVLAAHGIDIAPLRPANCGFDIGWSERFATRFAGDPLKPVIAAWTSRDGRPQQRQGECVITATGIEGSLVYAASADLREAIERDGQAVLTLDLAPGRSRERLASDLARPRGSRSFGEHLRRHLGLSQVKAALVFEHLGPQAAASPPATVIEAIKTLPLRLLRPRPLAEAISSAGGVRLEALAPTLMLKARPGVFCAGEMLDWEAPTGGYLLTACFASGRLAALGALDWLGRDRPNPPLP